ncbi:MAG: Glu-tRNA(Gln) amidotransferase subunit GatD [Nanoarchaeota archaeon]|nr:Glu-tRNA(Gln) amidotransferase subunit GatD [Nanoarchaeota archaeon]
MKKPNSPSQPTTDNRQPTTAKLSKIILTPGDLVKLQTKSKSWEGHALESHDPEIILLKLKSGYNIGIRENEILDATILEKSSSPSHADNRQPTTDNRQLPQVVIVITGGTISSRLDPKSGAVISTEGAQDILNIAPEIKKICNIIKIEKPFLKFSEDMSFPDWKILAETCEPHLNDPNIDGIIITHGTDFLHYTSAALAFFIGKPNKPIALTYSQRSIDRASTDAALNLICAAKYATSDIAEIALIGHKNTDDESCLAMPATKIRKMHTSKRDAFKIINSEPIAEISEDKFEIKKEFNAKDKKRKVKIDTKFQDKVASIKITPGLDPAILEFYKQQGYKGIVLEVTGIGQVPGKDAKFNWLPKIKKAIDNGMIICATPQTIYGTLNPNVYSAGRDLQKTGIIFLNETTETALIKLGYVLAHKQWNKKEKMLENLTPNP